MPFKKYKPEQIATLLGHIEVEIANGAAVGRCDVASSGT